MAVTTINSSPETSIQNTKVSWDMSPSDAYINHIIAHQSTSHLNQLKPNPRWVLLDNQSTVDVFMNKEVLRNIRKTVGKMMILSHGGSRATNLIGDLP